MRVLFLDIDGVLNDPKLIGRAYVGISLAPVPPLDPVRCSAVQWLLDTTGAVVVIASGWRRLISFDQIVALLRRNGLLGPIVDALPVVGADGRMVACRAWLASHPEVTSWCVIDDGLALWTDHLGRTPPWLSGHLVTPHHGVAANDISLAEQILLGGDP